MARGVLSSAVSGSVLVLDGNQRSALAATRSLGKRGIKVVVGDESRRTLAGSSRYCGGTVVYPSPDRDPTGFVEEVGRLAGERRIGVVFPMTDVTTQLMVEKPGAFSGISLPLPACRAYEAVTDKWRLYELARRLDVPVPQTELVGSSEELAAATARVGFPLVVKPRRSRIRSGTGWIAPAVRRVGCRDDLEGVVSREAAFGDRPYLVQECVGGQGQGVFALYDRGRPVVFFSHRRLREKPPWGGVSVLSESVGVDPALRTLSQRLLDEVQWHGVAMVEFKVGTGGPHLIEVNGRFWGSLQLAIDAGVDFPWLLYQLATGQEVEAAPDYRVGVRNRWLLGDLDHLYLKLKEKTSPREKWRALARFAGIGQVAARHEVDRVDDLGPFLFELRQYLGVRS